MLFIMLSNILIVVNNFNKIMAIINIIYYVSILII